MRKPPALFVNTIAIPTIQVPTATRDAALTSPSGTAAKIALSPSAGLLARLETHRQDGRHPVTTVRPSEVRAIATSQAPRARTAATRPGAARRGRPGRSSTLQKLLVTTLVIATIGTLASGTLATFNAQSSNANNQFATGTLILGDDATSKVQLSATILSAGSLASIPVYRIGTSIPAGTSITISDNATPTAHTQTLTTSGVTSAGATAIATTGGSAANNYPQTTATVAFPLYYSSVSTTGATIAGGATITTLTVSAIQNQIPSGTTLTLSNGVASQTLTLSVSAAAGSTSLTVTSATATAAYAAGSTVFWSASAKGVATTGSLSGSGVLSVPVNPLAAAIPAGAIVLLNNPSISAPNFQSLTVSAAGAALGATSIPLSASTTMNNTYPVGSLISYNYTTGSTCYSTAVSAGTFNNANANNGCSSMVFTNFGRPQASSEPSYTADLTISNQGSLPASKLTVYMQNCSTANNPAETFFGTSDLCTKLEMFLQEWSDSARTIPSTCWYGTVSGSTCTNPIPDPSPFLSAFNGSGTPLTLTGGMGAKGSSTDKRYFTIGLRLPATADNTYQGRIGTFDFVWTLQQ